MKWDISYKNLRVNMIRLQMVQYGIAKKKREIFSKWKHQLLSHVEKYQKMR